MRYVPCPCLLEVARTELLLCNYTPFYLNVDNNRDAWDKCRLKSELIVIMGALRFSFFKFLYFWTIIFLSI